MNHRRNRVRVMLVLCLILLLAWGHSIYGTAFVRVGQSLVIGSDGGAIYLVWPWSEQPRVGIRFFGKRQILRWSPTIQVINGVTFCYFPFWMPILVLCIPTAIIWRRDRRHPEGHCQGCGYDLTGNVSGVCSECGSKIEVNR